MIGGLTRGVRIKPNDGSGNTNDQQTKTDIVDQFCDSQYGSLAASNLRLKFTNVRWRILKLLSGFEIYQSYP